MKLASALAAVLIGGCQQNHVTSRDVSCKAIVTYSHLVVDLTVGPDVDEVRIVVDGEQQACPLELPAADAGTSSLACTGGSGVDAHIQPVEAFHWQVEIDREPAITAAEIELWSAGSLVQRWSAQDLPLAGCGLEPECDQYGCGHSMVTVEQGNSVYHAQKPPGPAR